MDQKESFVIVIPIPGKMLSANKMIATMGMRYQKASATRKLRRLAKEAVQDAGIDTMPWGACAVRATFVYPTKRRRDPDGAITSLKAAYDGIVDSGLVPDDDYEHMEREKPSFFIDKNNPCVILEITRTG